MSRKCANPHPCLFCGTATRWEMFCSYACFDGYQKRAKIQRRDDVKRLYQSGLTLEQVAAELGFHLHTVSRDLAAVGLKARPGTGNPYKGTSCRECGGKLFKGARCRMCHRIAKAQASRNSMRRKLKIPPERWIAS